MKNSARGRETVSGFFREVAVAEDDASAAYQASVKRFNRIFRAAAIAGVVVLIAWLYVVAHFVWKFW